MEIITIDTFEQAVVRCFAPIAKEYGFSLVRATEDIYEIPSPYFVMRIRFGVGHGRSISATLRPTLEPLHGANAEKNEFGVAVIAAYNGADVQTRPVSTLEEFSQQAQYVATMARQFCIPYLLGQKSDFANIREFIEKKTAKDLEEIKEYR